MRAIYTSGPHTGLEDGICNELIGERFRATIYRAEPSGVVRSRGSGSEVLSVRGWEGGRGERNNGGFGSFKLEATPPWPLVVSRVKTKEAVCVRNKSSRRPLKPGHGCVTLTRGLDDKHPSTSALNSTTREAQLPTVAPHRHRQLINALLLSSEG